MEGKRLLKMVEFYKNTINERLQTSEQETRMGNYGDEEFTIVSWSLMWIVNYI